MLMSNRLNASSVSDSCGILSPIMESTDCPGSQWEAVLDWMLALYSNIPPQYVGKVHFYSLPFSVQVTGKNAVRQLHNDNSVVYISATNATTLDRLTLGFDVSVATTQQVAVADALVTTASMWASALANAKPSKGHGSAFNDDQEAVHNVDDYYQPYVKSSCGFDTINGTDDQRSIFFPLPDDYSHLRNITLLDPQLAPIPAVEFPQLRKNQILELPGSPMDFRFRWVEIPASLSNPNRTSLGLVALQPQQEAQTLPQNTTSDIIVCRIDAGWGRSSMNTSSVIGTVTPVSSFPDPDGGSGSRVSQKQYSSHRNLVNGIQEVSFYQESIVSPTTWSTDDYPQIPITLTPEWAEFLNPVIPTLNVTVLNILFSIVGTGTINEPNLAVYVRNLLSLHIANALGRVGRGYEFQGIPKLVQLDQIDPQTGSKYMDVDGTAWIYAKDDFFTLDSADEGKNWLQFKVRSTIKGYAYNTTGFAPKVAISFLLTYCVIALTHVLYSGITGT